MNKLFATKFILIIAAAIVIVIGISVWQAYGTSIINVLIRSNPNLDYGLVGHWTFDGKDIVASTTANAVEAMDKSGNRNNGTLTGFGDNTSTSTPGVIGQALKFDGATDYVGCGNDTSLQFGAGSFTLEAWIKSRNVPTTWANIISKQGTNFGLTTFGGRSNELYYVYEGAGHWYSGVNVGDNKWHHVVFVRDGPNDNSTFYIDGAYIKSQTYNADWPSTGNLILGMYYIPSQYFSGSIDDVRIYNRALSADEITRLYDLGKTSHVNVTLKTNPNLESGLVGHWTFDGKDIVASTTANAVEAMDKSGNGNNGTLYGFGDNTSTSTPGVIGQALNFDGATDYVRLPNKFVFTPSQNFSVQVWFKTSFDYSSRDAGWIYGDYYSMQVDFIGLTIASSTPVNTAFFGFRDVGNNYTQVATTLVVNDNKWHHIVGVRDVATDKGYIYIDGMLINQATDITTGNVGNSLYAPRIGWNALPYTGQDSHFSGSIDDVRVYNRALSADEISRLYKLGR